MPHTLWLRILITVAVALGASWISLMYRFRHEGQPFGSPRACAWSVVVIAATSVLAAGVGVGLLKIDPVGPIAVGALMPALLCADRFGKPESPVEHSVWYKIATVGVILLLDQLEQQIDSDREKWAKARVYPHWTLSDLEEAVEEVNASLKDRVRSSPAHQKDLCSHYGAALKHISSAREANARRNRKAARKAEFAAKQALISMLGMAWDWGSTDISTELVRPPAIALTPLPHLDPGRPSCVPARRGGPERTGDRYPLCMRAHWSRRLVRHQLDVEVSIQGPAYRRQRP